jgi:4,5-DOPA dioxygenase extradiol
MTSPLDAATPGAAFDIFVREEAPGSLDQPVWTPADGSLPALFISHGAPPLFDDSLWIGQLFAWSQQLAKPTAILIVSAHWEHAPISLSATGAGVPLVYDFGGFPDRFFNMTYPTPDASTLAERVTSLLEANGPVRQHQSRGLDHGAWVPLKVMYPFGDVPVLQMSIPTHDPSRLLELGLHLRALREEGVLIIGSGFMTHGLPFLTHEMLHDNSVPSWSSEFDDWAATALDSGDVESLVLYQDRAPGLPYAHPTVEHFIPLLVTLGASSDPEQRVQTTIDGYQFGLSKRSFQVD